MSSYNSYKINNDKPPKKCFSKFPFTQSIIQYVFSKEWFTGNVVLKGPGDRSDRLRRVGFGSRKMVVNQATYFEAQQNLMSINSINFWWLNWILHLKYLWIGFLFSFCFVSMYYCIYSTVQANWMIVNCLVLILYYSIWIFYLFCFFKITFFFVKSWCGKAASSSGWDGGIRGTGHIFFRAFCFVFDRRGFTCLKKLIQLII